MKKKLFLFLALSSVAFFVVVSCFQKNNTLQKGGSEGLVSYNFDIRPILSDKCYACHGPDANKREAGLRLDVAENAYARLKDGKGVAIFPGKPDQSEVYKRITSVDPAYQMPTPESHLGLLSETEIGLVRKWIEQGAKYEKHWAFTAPVLPAMPEISDKEWPKNEIDHFVLQKMEGAGLAPNEQADKSHLLKRVSLDLTGLPPTLDLQNRFAADESGNAYEKVVDELLSQKAYGEKMAIYWLDVARYADSYGYQDDEVRTQWPWRDWLISAFNKNMRYDQFLTWQIAGDMLPNASKEQILATAFFRNHKYTEEGGVIPEEYRIEYNIDKTKTYSTGVLGLTVECAQCHDHKYDPISQEDYYRLFAFFNNSKELGFEGDISRTKPAKNPILRISDEEAKSLLTFINKPDTSLLMVSVMGDRDTLRPTHILNRGVYDAPGRVVTASALPAVMKFDTNGLPQNRLGLAKWTTSKSNPLTARVFVNQIWQEFIGRGIVKSTGDFGMQGDLPTNPALLDWLAVDFMNHGWDIKRLVKQIVTSATYRQSAKITEQKLKADPDNIFLSRGPRYRLPAELVRDMVLSTSGLLVSKIGGPSVKPYQPKGLWEAATSGRGTLKTYQQDKEQALYRRGMYTFIKLTVPPPSMIIFDASNRDHCEIKRSKTNTPLQALVMLNDPTVLEASRVLAERLTAKSTNIETNIKESFKRIVCRQPTDKEVKLLTEYYNSEASMFAKDKKHAFKVLNVGEYPRNEKVNEVQAAALMRVINTLYNMEETITKG
ncbi:PSD1 and planctomycete cytochrome C domain-containing protein [Dyadobacter chenhuakuii]|uniref:PSD1 and planctomycete cytochrome C domain-containing protein n=1 Tax=Dyadobacter chenhuakuii TaxID=2909339 RepID=A0ABY4XM73_9BACT|nr:PSD1 and planctomycete cytochrome C domain-containing protein [Dyadobacter chenhuakuii]MCF2494224.1 PSD1 and planctomycete cytochrome C domain-containing protein [Dyadobacter chenhuakuii]USJ31351.1 PSD1 and planctomycete cytochrome C domain-containing protein [Dyadobacter chenhuakuii]